MSFIGFDEDVEVVEIFKSFVFREADVLVLDVPEETNKFHYENKEFIALVWMPWYAEERYEVEHRLFSIVVE